MTTTPRRERARGSVPVAAVIVGVLAVGLASLSILRVGEAVAASAILRLVGTGATRVGTTVLVDTDTVPAGFTVANGCSTVLLAAPFLLLAALSLATGRVGVRRGLACLAGALAGVVAVNQLRFALVGGAVHVWGYERGYGQAHVLIGSLVSTAGLVGGITLFLLAMGRDPELKGEAEPC